MSETQALSAALVAIKQDPKQATLIINARSWSADARARIQQMGNNGNCGGNCGGSSASSSANIGDNQCAVWHAPNNDTPIRELINATACEVNACMPGAQYGLVPVPFRYTVASGASTTVNVGFSRASYLLNVMFLPSSDYDPRSWRIGTFSTSDNEQAWEKYRTGLTGGLSGYNPNTATFPALWWFENGDNSLSTWLHRMSLLPNLIPKTDLGTNNATANYTLTLAAGLPASQSIEGVHWVFYPPKKEG